MAAPKPTHHVGLDWSQMLAPFWHGLEPQLPWLVSMVVVIFVLVVPHPLRGPNSRKRDRWRSYKFDIRRQVIARAGGRCEAAAFIWFGRCHEPAAEADHVYPWSKGGPTTVMNGQALCRGHNRHKAAMTPPWWYILLLERRRRSYVPPGTPIRVSAALSNREKRRTPA